MSTSEYRMQNDSYIKKMIVHILLSSMVYADIIDYSLIDKKFEYLSSILILKYYCIIWLINNCLDFCRYINIFELQN